VRGAPRSPLDLLIQWANKSGAPILSNDIPSGLDATTGETPGVYIQPTWTITLGLPKLGLLLNPKASGKVFLGDVGIPLACFSSTSLSLTSPYISPYLSSFIVELKIVSEK